MKTEKGVRLEEITAETWYEVCQLRVAADQQEFLESNAISIAQSKFEPTLQLRAIVHGDDLVGFLMFNTDSEELDAHWIYRLMIDERYQRQGVARQAMALLLQEMKTLPGCCRLVAGYSPKNRAAGALYASLGFEDRGDRFGKEMAVVLDL